MAGIATSSAAASLHPCAAGGSTGPHGAGLSPAAWVAVVLAGLLAGACAPLSPPPDPVVPAAREPECERCVELTAEVARLRRDLAGRDVEVRELRAQHRDQARTLEEFARTAIRTTAKLRRQATRADAASVIADVEVAIVQAKSVNGKAAGALVALAEELLVSASAAFSRGEYSIAYDQADQAWQIANVAADERADARARGETRFGRAIALRVRIESNLREHPGMKSAIVGQLKAASLVVARASRGAWTRVMSADGRAGWIYSPLLGPR